MDNLSTSHGDHDTVKNIRICRLAFAFMTKTKAELGDFYMKDEDAFFAVLGELNNSKRFLFAAYKIVESAQARLAIAASATL